MNNQIITIPLSQLARSKANMRKTGRLVDIKQLAASIEANGLLENLVVHRCTASADNLYEVVAGGRRLEALKRLVKTEAIPQDHPVPCLVIEDVTVLTEISLTENFERVPAHPADQFEAFAKLRQKDNTSVGDIAARFGVSTAFVEQRLRLAQVSKRLIAEYRKDAMTLEQLMAFTVSDDPVLQDNVWFESPYRDMDATSIRRHLTQTQVEASDRRAVFIGAKAYEAAGGTIVRDLFDRDHEGYFADSQLLDRLVAEKLSEVTEGLREEGWSWVEAMDQTDFSYLAGFGRVAPSEAKLPKADEKKLAKLGKRYDELIALLEENEDGEAAQELDGLEAALQSLRARKECWRTEEKARGGAIAHLERDGSVSITRGLLRGMPNQEQTVPRKQQRAGYADSVLSDLSAHRTAALRECMASRPDVAFVALLYGLVSALFHGERCACVEMSVTSVDLSRISQTVGESRAAKALQARAAQWAERVPEPDALLSWLVSLGDSERQALMAYCASLSFNALYTRNEGRRQAATTFANLLKLDMTHWWEPSAEFFSRLTKAEICLAVSEGVSSDKARALDDLKKSDLAKRAAELLAQGNWLPESLRAPQTA